MTDFELNTHARLVALEYLLRNLYYMQYRSLGATGDDILSHHRGLSATVRSDLDQKVSEKNACDSVAAAVLNGIILNLIEAHLNKNLAAIRSMWETTPRSRGRRYRGSSRNAGIVQ
jgi:hypothetical protein